MKIQIIGALLAAGLLLGCQTQQQKADARWASQATPQQVSSGSRIPAADQALTWAGKVQAVRNLKSSTHLEVLSYPLDAQGRPVLSGQTGGRFIAEMEGFLEPNEFPVGTPVTVKGHYARLLRGKVGDAAYVFPLLLGDRLDVWQSEQVQPGADKPDVRWSIGVGTGGSGVGVGIGF